MSPNILITSKFVDPPPRIGTFSYLKIYHDQQVAHSYQLRSNVVDPPSVQKCLPLTGLLPHLVING